MRYSFIFVFREIARLFNNYFIHRIRRDTTFQCTLKHFWTVVNHRKASNNASRRSRRWKSGESIAKRFATLFNIATKRLRGCFERFKLLVCDIGHDRLAELSRASTSLNIHTIVEYHLQKLAWRSQYALKHLCTSLRIAVKLRNPICTLCNIYHTRSCSSIFDRVGCCRVFGVIFQFEISFAAPNFRTTVFTYLQSLNIHLRSHF